MTDSPASLHRLARIALYAALTGAAAFVHVPVGPLFISLQTLLVMLAGFMLGPKNALLAMLLYLACGGLGLPVFGQGKAGPAAFLGPTAGYFLAFPAAAALAGCATFFQKSRTARLVARAVFGLAGTALILLSGTLVLRMGFIQNWPRAFAVGFLPFIIGDSVKMLAAAVICEGLPRHAAPGGNADVP